MQKDHLVGGDGGGVEELIGMGQLLLEIIETLVNMHEIDTEATTFNVTANGVKLASVPIQTVLDAAGKVLAKASGAA